MSGISGTKQSFVEMITETIGYKSGLALTVEELTNFTPDKYVSILEGDKSSPFHIRTEEFDFIISALLFRLGKISSDSTENFVIYLFQKYHNSNSFLYAIIALYTAFITDISSIASTIQRHEELKDKSVFQIIEHIATRLCILIPKSICDKSYESRIIFWLSMLSNEQIPIQDNLVESIKIALNDFIIRSPWLKVRTIEWKDIRPLAELFNSEKTVSSHGMYFDQRFTDFLAANFKTIRDINWRQFEGFTAEYLHSNKFDVQLGKGRDDDGIDIRAWAMTPFGPLQLLIQCKRQNTKVGKTIVKSLWADIEHYDAGGGLIVTTSELSPGARKTIVTRHYPIMERNFQDLQQWLLKMRTPWTGIFYPSLWNN